MDCDSNIVLLLNLMFLMTWVDRLGCKCLILMPITSYILPALIMNCEL